MSTDPVEYADPIPDDRDASLPEELPVVEPPSAGFIMQLFLVPALIVMALVGGWLLMGKLFSVQQDWRELVTELRTQNEHRRWRAALGLAQVLKADRDQGDQGQQLAKNPEIAKALVEALDQELKSERRSKEDISHQVFLVSALGLLDRVEISVPALQTALAGDFHEDVRSAALIAIAVVGNRAMEEAQKGDARLQEEILELPDLSDDVIELTEELSPLLREKATFALGFLPEPTATQRLEVLTNDRSYEIRVDAAIALCRHGSTAGFNVYREILTSKERPDTAVGGMELVAMKNVLKAVGDLASKWRADERDELAEHLRVIVKSHNESRIRADAGQALRALEAI